RTRGRGSGRWCAATGSSGSARRAAPDAGPGADARTLSRAGRVPVPRAFSTRRPASWTGFGAPRGRLLGPGGGQLGEPSVAHHHVVGAADPPVGPGAGEREAPGVRLIRERVAPGVDGDGRR